MKFSTETTIDLNYRGSARVIAYIEIGFLIQQLLVLAIFLCSAVFIGIHFDDLQDLLYETYEIRVQLTPEYKTIGAMIFGTIFMILLFWCFLQAWATTNLMTASKTGKDSRRAHKCARVWFGVSIFMVIVQSLILLLSGLLMILPTYLLINGAFLHIVKKFMEELKIKIEYEGLQNSKYRYVA